MTVWVHTRTAPKLQACPGLCVQRRFSPARWTIGSTVTVACSCVDPDPALLCFWSTRSAVAAADGALIAVSLLSNDVDIQTVPVITVTLKYELITCGWKVGGGAAQIT